MEGKNDHANKIERLKDLMKRMRADKPSGFRKNLNLIKARIKTLEAFL